jgi:dolichol-phosphate mannosyltransferase
MNDPQHATVRKLITISVPVLNEEGNIDGLLRRIGAVASNNADYDFEFLFTDNCSTDNTFAKLAEHAARDDRIRVLRFSRNFGFQQSLLTNLLNSRGAAAILIDADLQDPPELIADFLRHWERGYKVVYGIRRRRAENPFTQLARKAHYRLIKTLSETDVPLDAGDFRLIDRVVIEDLRTYTDKSPYLRGIIASIGYPQMGIPYDRSDRLIGKTKFNLQDLIRLSIDGICSQSTRPLQYITMFGFTMSILSALMIAVYLIDHFFISKHPEAPGFTTLVLLVLVSIGINATFVGLIGEYVGRIYNNVRGGSPAIVADRIEQAASQKQVQ